jgi:hypothetical protein
LGFAAFIPLPMAREEKKQVVLRPVDDEVLPVVEVVRLENPETGHKTKREEPVRLGAQEAVRTPSRLDLPSREEVELRTHQPGIDVLIKSTTVVPEFTEDAWGEDAARKNPVPWGWFALIGLALAGALVWSLINLKESEMQAGQIRENTRSVLASEEEEETAARELVERIEAALKRYFKTVTVESLARQVRQPERVVPLMRNYYARQPLKVNSIASVRNLQPVTLGNRANFWIASVTLFDGTKPNLVIEIDPAGNPLIDWETQVCYQPMPWDEFARDRPAGRSLDFRVYAEKDSFFSHEFSDAGGWLCFRLTALGAEESMFGYVRADSEEARKLLDVIQNNGSGQASLILRLSIPERLQSRQGVVIEKVLSTRWIYLDLPEDAS